MSEVRLPSISFLGCESRVRGNGSVLERGFADLLALLDREEVARCREILPEAEVRFPLVVATPLVVQILEQPFEALLSDRLVRRAVFLVRVDEVLHVLVRVLGRDARGVRPLFLPVPAVELVELVGDVSDSIGRVAVRFVGVLPEVQEPLN